MKTFSFALSLLSACLVSAQTPTPTPAPGQRHHMRPAPSGSPDDMLENRLTMRLGLNATQQNGVHTALAEARVQQNGMSTQMRTLHTQMLEAIKTGNTDQIDSISSQLSEFHKQQTSIHAKTMAKIYGSLTSDQKIKVGTNLDMLMGRMGPGFGPGGPGPGMHRPGARPAQSTSTPQQQ